MVLQFRATHLVTAVMPNNSHYLPTNTPGFFNLVMSSTRYLKQVRAINVKKQWANTWGRVSTYVVLEII